jgi:DNA-binding beta-propeller fold protein YncE
VFALLLAAPAQAAIEIRPLTEVIEGHQVGGVSADMVGDLYVADFGETVWKISLEGERRVFATGLYGASGNAIDNEGNLLQANFYGDSLTRIDRKGEAKPFASGLRGPVGVTIDRRTGEVYVANCRGNIRFRESHPTASWSSSQAATCSSVRTASRSTATALSTPSTFATTAC